MACIFFTEIIVKAVFRGPLDGVREVLLLRIVLETKMALIERVEEGDDRTVL